MRIRIHIRYEYENKGKRKISYLNGFRGRMKEESQCYNSDHSPHNQNQNNVFDCKGSILSWISKAKHESEEHSDAIRKNIDITVNEHHLQVQKAQEHQKK